MQWVNLPENYEGDAFYNGDVGRGKNKVSHDKLLNSNECRLGEYDSTNNSRIGLKVYPLLDNKVFLGAEAWANIYQKPEQDPWAWQYEGGTKGLNKAQLAYLAIIEIVKELMIIN